MEKVNYKDQLLTGFLRKQFPIKRVKDKKTKRFKVGIDINRFVSGGKEGRIYVLRVEGERNAVIRDLFDITKNTFGFSDDIVLTNICNYLEEYIKGN